MADINFALTACALSFVLACGLSVLISYFIMKTRVEKNEKVFMQKLSQLDDGISRLNDETAACRKDINEAKTQCDLLKKDIEKKSAEFAARLAEANSENETVMKKIEKINVKFADVNDRMNVLDSTIKNIERMKDFEINGEESPYFFDENNCYEQENIKEKIISGAQKMANFVSDLSIDAIAGTAFGIVNAVKKHFDKD